MNKIAILIFALAISHAFGACDADVKTHFSVTAAAATPPAAGNELPSTIVSCASLIGDLACCTAAEIVSQIQTEATTFQTQLETAAGVRDTAILAARKAVGDQYANYALWFIAAASADTVLDGWATTQPSGVTAQQVTDAQAAITSVGTTLATFYTNYATIRTAYTTYQTARAACFAEILRYRVSARCLACHDDGDFTNWGVDNTGAPTIAITYGAGVETALAAACQPYFVASETVTDVFIVESYAAQIEDMTTALTKIAASTAAGVAEFITAATPAAQTGTPSEIDTATCSTTDCDWLVDTIFVDGLIADQTSLIQGGTAVVRRRLQSRILQSGSFAPVAATEAKITITFPADPTGDGNPVDLSALRVGVFSCIVAFFVALLF